GPTSRTRSWGCDRLPAVARRTVSMRSRKTTFFRITASLVVASFAWLTGGGHAWAELRAAERSPAQALARLADDPRLALSAAERDYLRAAAGTLASAPPAASSSERSGARPAPARPAPAAAAAPPAIDPAAEMQEIARELDRVAAGAAAPDREAASAARSEEHTSELQSRFDIVCR